MLVVGSNDVLRRVLVRSLGVRVAVDDASGLARAREKLRATSYDIVVTEDRLPDGGGCALLADLRAGNRSCRRALMSVFGPAELEGDLYERAFVMPQDLTALIVWIDEIRTGAERSRAVHPLDDLPAHGTIGPSS